MKSIGYVHRSSKNEDVRDRSLVSRIVVNEDFTAALDGLEDFSHLYVLFHLHQVSGAERKTMKLHPRGRADMPLLGVFATRTAFRPNPIGLTLVELLERRKNVLVVRGLDAFDGTPVLDLKPADHADTAKNLRLPKWLDLLHKEKRARDVSKH
jgi:tRNA-Thr(GGU) m(6)t(6)A37 methyltransferase TsaA